MLHRVAPCTGMNCTVLLSGVFYPPQWLYAHFGAHTVQAPSNAWTPKERKMKELGLSSAGVQGSPNKSNHSPFTRLQATSAAHCIDDAMLTCVLDTRIIVAGEIEPDHAMPLAVYLVA